MTEHQQPEPGLIGLPRFVEDVAFVVMLISAIALVGAIVALALIV